MRVDRVVSCLNTRAVIWYVKRHYPELMESLLVDLDPYFDTIDNLEEFFMDEHNWISQHVCVKLFERVRLHSGNNEVARDIGRESILYRRLGYIENIFIKAIGHPYLGVSRVMAINAKFNKTKTVEIVESDWSHAVVRLKWFPGMGSTKDICLHNLGVYESIPTIWGLPLAKITEHSCYFNGDEYCEFTMEWAKKSLLALLFDMFIRRRERSEIYRDTLAELEREKELMVKKYLEIGHLNTELKKRVERLTSLDACSKATASLLDTDKLLDVVMSLIINVMQFDRAIIMLVDEERRFLEPVKMAGEDDHPIASMKQYSIPLDRKSNILARVVDSGIAQIVTDVDNSILRKENLILKTFNPKSFVAVPLITRNKVMGLLAAERIKGLGDFSSNDLDYLMNFCSQIAISLENARLIDNMKKSFMTSILSLASALEAKDPFIRGHSNRVAIYATIIARRMDIDEERVELIRQMALMHDIGKIGIPDSIINKEGKLTEEEFAAIKRHPIVSMQIIQPLMTYHADISLVRSHHERYDGRGYPDGIGGEDIPLEARILAVADSYDAMTSDRPYRAAMSREAAVAEINRNRGRQFCPRVVDVFEMTIPTFPEDLFRLISEEQESMAVAERSIDRINVS
jgi:HD-GYP domain-containing protein (c-di-GMP phosphodiesterase class II)